MISIEKYRVVIFVPQTFHKRRNLFGPHVRALAFRRADVTLECGTPRGFRMAGDSGRTLERQFCADCGAPLFTDLEKYPELLLVNAGALDDPAQVHIKAHIFAAAAPHWHHFEPDVPRYDGDLPPRPPRAS